MTSVSPTPKDTEAERAKMSEPTGLHDKYRVKRMDDSPRHPDCRYFVLDLTHDPYAMAALMAYAEGCQYAHPQLAADLRDIRRTLDRDDQARVERKLVDRFRELGLDPETGRPL